MEHTVREKGIPISRDLEDKILFRSPISYGNLQRRNV